MHGAQCAYYSLNIQVFANFKVKNISKSIEIITMYGTCHIKKIEYVLSLHNNIFNNQKSPQRQQRKQVEQRKHASGAVYACKGGLMLAVLYNLCTCNKPMICLIKLQLFGELLPT